MLLADLVHTAQSLKSVYQDLHLSHIEKNKFREVLAVDMALTNFDNTEIEFFKKHIRAVASMEIYKGFTIVSWSFGKDSTPSFYKASRSRVSISAGAFYTKKVERFFVKFDKEWLTIAIILCKICIQY